MDERKRVLIGVALGELTSYKMNEPCLTTYQAEYLYQEGRMARKELGWDNPYKREADIKAYRATSTT